VLPGDNERLREIEAYYAQLREDGTSEYRSEESKKASANSLKAILGDRTAIQALGPLDFVHPYARRWTEIERSRAKACSSAAARYRLCLLAAGGGATTPVE